MLICGYESGGNKLQISKETEILKSKSNVRLKGDLYKTGMCRWLMEGGQKGEIRETGSIFC